MTIGMAFLALILGLWSVGGWMGYQERAKHPPRFEGHYRTPCLDVHGPHEGYGSHESRRLQLC